MKKLLYYKTIVRNITFLTFFILLGVSVGTSARAQNVGDNLILMAWCQQGLSYQLGQRWLLDQQAMGYERMALINQGRCNKTGNKKVIVTQSDLNTANWSYVGEHFGSGTTYGTKFVLFTMSTNDGEALFMKVERF